MDTAVKSGATKIAFAGLVTKSEDDKFGMVRDDVFFLSSVVKGPFPKVGDRVLVQAEAVHGMPFNYVAKRLQILFTGQEKCETPAPKQQQPKSSPATEVNPLESTYFRREINDYGHKPLESKIPIENSQPVHSNVTNTLKNASSSVQAPYTNQNAVTSYSSDYLRRREKNEYDYERRPPSEAPPPSTISNLQILRPEPVEYLRRPQPTVPAVEYVTQSLTDYSRRPENNSHDYFRRPETNDYSRRPQMNEYSNSNPQTPDNSYRKVNTSYPVENLERPPPPPSTIHTQNPGRAYANENYSTSYPNVPWTHENPSRSSITSNLITSYPNISGRPVTEEDLNYSKGTTYPNISAKSIPEEPKRIYATEKLITSYPNVSARSSSNDEVKESNSSRNKSGQNVEDLRSSQCISSKEVSRHENVNEKRKTPYSIENDTSSKDRRSDKSQKSRSYSKSESSSSNESDGGRKRRRGRDRKRSTRRLREDSNERKTERRKVSSKSKSSSFSSSRPSWLSQSIKITLEDELEKERKEAEEKFRNISGSERLSKIYGQDSLKNDNIEKEKRHRLAEVEFFHKLRTDKEPKKNLDESTKRSVEQIVKAATPTKPGKLVSILKPAKEQPKPKRGIVEEQTPSKSPAIPTLAIISTEVPKKIPKLSKPVKVLKGKRLAVAPTQPLHKPPTADLLTDLYSNPEEVPVCLRCKKTGHIDRFCLAPLVHSMQPHPPGEIPNVQAPVPSLLPNPHYQAANTIPLPPPRYQAPPTPTPLYQAPPTPTSQYQAPPTPTPLYQAPPIRAPLYQAPPTPAPHYQAPPIRTPLYQAPPTPTPLYQTPPTSSTPYYQAPPQKYQTPPTGPSPGYQAPPTPQPYSYQASPTMPSSGYHASPTLLPTPSHYQAPPTNYLTPPTAPPTNYQIQATPPPQQPYCLAPPSAQPPSYQTPPPAPPPNYNTPANYQKPSLLSVKGKSIAYSGSESNYQNTPSSFRNVNVSQKIQEISAGAGRPRSPPTRILRSPERSTDRGQVHCGGCFVPYVPGVFVKHKENCPIKRNSAQSSTSKEIRPTSNVSIFPKSIVNVSVAKPVVITIVEKEKSNVAQDYPPKTVAKKLGSPPVVAKQTNNMRLVGATKALLQEVQQKLNVCLRCKKSGHFAQDCRSTHNTQGKSLCNGCSAPNIPGVVRIHIASCPLKEQTSSISSISTIDKTTTAKVVSETNVQVSKQADTPKVLNKSIGLLTPKIEPGTESTTESCVKVSNVNVKEPEKIVKPLVVDQLKAGSNENKSQSKSGSLNQKVPPNSSATTPKNDAVPKETDRFCSKCQRSGHTSEKCESGSGKSDSKVSNISIGQKKTLSTPQKTKSSTDIPKSPAISTPLVPSQIKNEKDPEISFIAEVIKISQPVKNKESTAVETIKESSSSNIEKAPPPVIPEKESCKNDVKTGSSSENAGKSDTDTSFVFQLPPKPQRVPKLRERNVSAQMSDPPKTIDGPIEKSDTEKKMDKKEDTVSKPESKIENSKEGNKSLENQNKSKVAESKSKKPETPVKNAEKTLGAKISTYVKYEHNSTLDRRPICYLCQGVGHLGRNCKATETNAVKPSCSQEVENNSGKPDVQIKNAEKVQRFALPSEKLSKTLRVPDGRPICFRCQGTGHVAKHCTATEAAPLKPRCPGCATAGRVGVIRDHLDSCLENLNVLGSNVKKSVYTTPSTSTSTSASSSNFKAGSTKRDEKFQPDGRQRRISQDRQMKGKCDKPDFRPGPGKRLLPQLIKNAETKDALKNAYTTPGGDPVCFRCQKTGHITKHCHSKRSATGESLCRGCSVANIPGIKRDHEEDCPFRPHNNFNEEFSNPHSNDSFRPRNDFEKTRDSENSWNTNPRDESNWENVDRNFADSPFDNPFTHGHVKLELQLHDGPVDNDPWSHGIQESRFNDGPFNQICNRDFQEGEPLFNETPMQGNRNSGFENGPFNRNPDFENGPFNRNPDFENGPINRNQENRNRDFDNGPFDRNQNQGNRHSDFENGPININQENRNRDFDNGPFDRNQNQGNRNSDFENEPFNRNRGFGDEPLNRNQENRNCDFENEPFFRSRGNNNFENESRFIEEGGNTRILRDGPFSDFQGRNDNFREGNFQNGPFRGNGGSGEFEKLLRDRGGNFQDGPAGGNPWNNDRNFEDRSFNDDFGEPENEIRWEIGIALRDDFNRHDFDGDFPDGPGNKNQMDWDNNLEGENFENPRNDSGRPRNRKLRTKESGKIRTDKSVVCVRCQRRGHLAQICHATKNTDGQWLCRGCSVANIPGVHRDHEVDCPFWEPKQESEDGNTRPGDEGLVMRDIGEYRASKSREMRGRGGKCRGSFRN